MGRAVVTQIKAVIFDYYGVLLANTHEQRLSQLWADSPDRAAEFSAVNRAADRGILSYEESRRRMAELMAIPYEQLLQEYAQGEMPNEALITYIHQQLKGRYRVGLLSNSTSRAQLDVRFEPGRLDTIFDAIVSSGDIGYVKPQPEAYAHAAAALGVHASECIMVDDVEAYCLGAAAAGMQAIHFTSVEGAIASLEEVLDEMTKKVYN